MVSINLTAADPNGIQRKRCMNSSHYTEDEINRNHLEFKKWVQAGKDHRLFRFQKNPILQHSINEPKALEMFERRHIKDLEIDKSLGGCSFAVIGSTKSGKSYCMNFIVKEFFKKHITFLMSLTSHGAVYDPFRKDSIIAEKFCPELIEEAFLINKRTANEYDFLFVFDDLALDGKNDKMMTRLLTTGRNVGCSAIISGQKTTMLSATGRSNTNYVCLFYQNTDTEIEASIKSWLRSFFPRGMSVPDMCRVYREMTQDHNFFLVDTLNSKCFISRI